MATKNNITVQCELSAREKKGHYDIWPKWNARAWHDYNGTPSYRMCMCVRGVEPTSLTPFYFRFVHYSQNWLDGIHGFRPQSLLASIFFFFASSSVGRTQGMFYGFFFHLLVCACVRVWYVFITIIIARALIGRRHRQRHCRCRYGSGEKSRRFSSFALLYETVFIIFILFIQQWQRQQHTICVHNIALYWRQGMSCLARSAHA